MGCKSSKQRLKRETALTLASNTHFSEDDVFALHGLFRKLSSSLTDDGLISKEEFELGLFRDRKQHSLLADRIFHLFDFKNDGVIEFEEFVRSLSVFHPDAPKPEKIAFSFRLYDIWQTDFIEREVVKELILAVLNESDIMLPDNVVESIVDKTFQEADSKGDGKIDIDEWNEFASRNPNLLKNMTIPYLKDIPTAFPSFTWESDM